MIPYKNTFGTDNLNPFLQKFLAATEYFIAFIFGIDVILGFRKAYLNEMYLIVTDPRMIAIKYLKFFFWVDLLSAIPFDYFVKKGFMRYIGLIKAFRLLRLKKVINNLGFGTSNRAKFRIIQLIVTLLMLIHLTTCYFKAVTHKNYHSLNSQDFNLNFWLPQVDLNDSETTFYEDTTKNQYIKSFYYAFLLITGNDIAPQTPEEITFCITVIFFGQFLVSYIFGGIADEVLRSQ